MVCPLTLAAFTLGSRWQLTLLPAGGDVTMLRRAEYDQDVRLYGTFTTLSGVLGWVGPLLSPAL